MAATLLRAGGAAMCYRYLRVILLLTGSLLLFVAVFPVMLFIRLEEPLQTTLIASKLIMLPAGAICFLVASVMHAQRR